MTDYELRTEFYLPFARTEICYLGESHRDGDLVFLDAKDKKIFIHKDKASRLAFPATLENYEKLSQLWPDLEKPPAPAREDVDVTDIVMLSDEEYKTHQPTSLPCVCWVRNLGDSFSTIAVITKKDDDFGYFYNSRNEGWDLAIPLTKGELEQLTKLNGEAK